MEKVHTNSAPAAIGPYSQAIVHNGLVYSSGQIAINPEVGDVVAKDIEGQSEQVLKNLSEVLKAANSSMENIIKTTCFLADINDFGKFNEVYAKYISEKPARSCVAVKDLPKGALVEVEVIATVNE